MATRLVMSIDTLPNNGPHRATFSVNGGPERTVVALIRSQALDKAFAEIRKIIKKES